MTVADLIDQLEQFDPDAPVRVAYQPDYPLRGTVANVAPLEGDAEVTSPLNAVWIAVGHAPYNENPYAPSEAWE